MSARAAASCAAAPVPPALAAVGYRRTDRVVLYDGVCGLCNGGVDFVERWSGPGLFKYAALQGPIGERLLDLWGVERGLASVVYVDGRGGVFLRSRAMLGIGKEMGGVIGALSAAAESLVPLRVADWVYVEVIAKNRYSVFGKRDVCRIGDEGTGGKFLD